MSLTRPPQIAFETIHYAVEALMFGRKHALDVIREEGNGLNPEQKIALCQKIQQLQDRPKTVKEKKRLENRLIGVLQPATLKFLETPTLVGRVLVFSMRWDWEAQLQTLSIQSTTREVVKGTLQNHLSTHKIVDAVGIETSHQLIYGKNQTFTVEQCTEILLLAPEFTTLGIHNTLTQKDLISLIKKAIARCGEKTKFRRIEIRTHFNFVDLQNCLDFPKLTEMRIHEGGLFFNVDFSRLKKLDIRILSTTAPSLLFNTPQLTDLIVRYSMPERVSSGVFLNHIKEWWVKLPISGVDFSDSKAGEDVFQPVAKLPKLLWLDLSRCKSLNVARIAAILRERKTLRMLNIEPHETLSVPQIADLQGQFPFIDIRTQKGIRFRDALPEGKLIWV